MCSVRGILTSSCCLSPARPNKQRPGLDLYGRFIQMVGNLRRWWVCTLIDHFKLHFKVAGLSPGWCGSVDWMLACEPKGHQFDPQSGHMPGLWARSPVGGMWEATTYWCSSPSLSPSIPLCLHTHTHTHTATFSIWAVVFSCVLAGSHLTLEHSGEIPCGWLVVLQGHKGGTACGLLESEWVTPSVPGIIAFTFIDYKAY